MVSTGSTAGPPGRILVLLDGSRLSRAALAAAADIAGHEGREVLGVFVEEANLLRSAAYPFTREVGGTSGERRPMNRVALEQRLRRLAEQARASLTELAAQRGYACDLSVIRGHVVDEVLALARPQDLLVLGRTGWSEAIGMQLGSTARGLMHQAPGAVLLWCEVRKPMQRVVVLLNDHDEANERALLAAQSVCRHRQQPVTVVVPPTDSLTESKLADLRAATAALGKDCRLRQLTSLDVATVARVLREEGASQLVISRQSALFRQPGIEPLLLALNLPVTVTP